MCVEKSAKIIVSICLWAVIASFALADVFQEEREKETQVSESRRSTYGRNRSSSCRVVFASELDGKWRPMDTINKISLSEEEVFIFTYWRNIPNTRHRYTCKIFNAFGEHLLTNTFKFVPKNGNYRTWTFYKFTKKDRYRHGKWKFEIYLDGAKWKTKTLEVLDEHGRAYNPARIKRLLKKVPLLKKSLEQYRGLRGYRSSILCRYRREQPAGNLQADRPGQFLLAFQRPNRVRFQSLRDKQLRVVAVSDGATVFNYFTKKKRYRKNPVPDRLFSRYTSLQSLGSLALPVILLSPMPSRSLLDEMRDAEISGKERIDGIPTTIVVLTLSPVAAVHRFEWCMNPWSRSKTLRLWIGDNDRLIRKIEYQSDAQSMPFAEPEYRRITEVYRDIETNPAFTAKTFTFVPPDDAELVTSYLPRRKTKNRELIGKTAPDFSLKNLSGENVTLADFKGKVLVIDFWATWCSPCKKEMPTFVKLHRDFSAKGFSMIGVSTDYGTEVVQKFAKKHKLNFPLLMADKKIQKDYGGIASIPTAFVVDKKGVVRYCINGKPPDTGIFREYVIKLLGEH